jgi:hypothetical protein
VGVEDESCCSEKDAGGGGFIRALNVNVCRIWRTATLLCGCFCCTVAMPRFSAGSVVTRILQMGGPWGSACFGRRL